VTLAIGVLVSKAAMADRVVEKKTMFFRVLAPNALYVNELILVEDRERAATLLEPGD
jgi:hypothetical protein